MTGALGSLTDSRGYSIRVPMRQEIRVRFDGQNDDIEGALLDLSVGGMAIQCVVETTVGCELSFVFEAAGTGVEIRGRGRVVWTRPAKDADDEEIGLAQLGVEFVPLAEADLEEVEEIVRSLMTELQRADAEVARLRLVSEKQKRRSTRPLEAMRKSVQSSAKRWRKSATRV